MRIRCGALLGLIPLAGCVSTAPEPEVVRKKAWRFEEVTLGTDVEAAVDLALEVETLSEVYWRARQIGEPNLLTDAQVDDAISKFETYGPTSRD